MAAVHKQMLVRSREVPSEELSKSLWAVMSDTVIKTKTGVILGWKSEQRRSRADVLGCLHAHNYALLFVLFIAPLFMAL